MRTKTRIAGAGGTYHKSNKLYCLLIDDVLDNALRTLQICLLSVREGDTTIIGLQLPLRTTFA